MLNHLAKFTAAAFAIGAAALAIAAPIGVRTRTRANRSPTRYSRA